MHMLGFTIPGLGPVSQFFATVLKVLSTFTGSFGWAIILLTVGFRIVTLPLTIKQTKSMIAMQRLQPQLKEVQKKFKDDREKMGQEMMKLYKENKVSPLGGCLPLLIQLPILFALFDVLHNVTKYNQLKGLNYAFLGINNILATGKIMWSGGTIKFWNAAGKVANVPYKGGEYPALIILVVLTIITGYISAKMMTTDPKQARMMMLMPLLFGFFAWILPAGVTIYIIVINALTIVQQYFQLWREGFYEEKRKEREKDGNQPGLAERLTGPVRQRVVNAAAALRGKPMPVESKPKPAGKATKETNAGSGSNKEKSTSQTPVKKKPAGTQAKAGSGGKMKAPAVGPKGQQGKPGNQKVEKKSYPAKKKK